jgi:hypothetical protein
MESSGNDSSSNGAEDPRRLSETERIVAAVQKASAEAIRMHKRLGVPIVIWRDGKVVIVPPEEIQEFPDPR